MGKLFNALNDYKREKNDEILEIIECELKKEINMIVCKIESFFRDDLYQEILIDIPKLCNKFNFLSLEEIKKQHDFEEILEDFLLINNGEMEKEKFIIYYNEKNFVIILKVLAIKNLLIL